MEARIDTTAARDRKDVAWYRSAHKANRVLPFVVAGAVGAALGLAAILSLNAPTEWAPFVLLALVLPFAALVVGDLRRLLLTIILFDIAFPVNFHLDYHLQEAAFGALGGLEISVTTISIPILYGAWFADLMTRRSRGGPRPRLGPGVPLLLYVAFAALSIVVARNTSLSFFEVAMLFQTLLLFIYIVGTVRTREEVVFLVTVLLASFALQSVVMILAPFGLSFKLGSLASRVDVASGTVVASLFRTAGTVGSPILAASYVALLIPLALGVLLTPLGRGHKGLAAAALVLGSIALLLTFSRGGWIAAGLPVLIFTGLAWRRGWLSPIVPLSVVALALTIGLVFAGSVAERFGDQQSTLSRLPLIEIAYRVIQDHPLTGVGANNIVVVEPDYKTPDLAGAWIYATHDKYLLVWAETGIGAFLAFVVFLVTSVRWGLRTWAFRDRLLSPIGLALGLAIAGQMIHMFVDVFNSRPQVQELWVAAALIAAICNIECLGEGHGSLDVRTRAG